MRKTCAMLMTGLLIFILCACAENNEAESIESEVQIPINEAEVFEENKELEEEILQSSTEKETNILVINEGDIFVLSDGINELEITLDCVNIEQEIHSLVEDTNNYSQYYADIEDESYVIMKLNIKNIGSDSISQDVFEGYNSKERKYNEIALTFEDKYNYKMTQLDTQNIIMSSYWKIEPLKSQAIYFWKSVPDEIIEKPYTIQFSLANGDTYCIYNGQYENIRSSTDNNESSDFIDGNHIADLLEEYPSYVNELSNYVTSIHRTDFGNGQSFADFDDYTDYFSDFFIWAAEIIDFNGEVEEEFQELWKEFQELVKHHADVLNESYDKNNAEALSLINQLMNYISEKSSIISQLIKNIK